MLKIGIIDDHTLFRKSLRMLVNSFAEMDVVWESGHPSEIFEIFLKNPIDILLLDIQMPNQNGYELCKSILRIFPHLKILFISQLATSESVSYSLQAGAKGYFTKYSDPLQLEVAINSVWNNDFYFATEIRGLLKNALNNDLTSIILPEVQLTKREIEVIEMACKQYGSNEIAERLFINVRTVESHRKRIMEKTNSKNFLGSIIYAIKNGLVSIDT